MFLLKGFPQFPDDRLEPKVYDALKQIHLAFANFDEAVSLGTGMASYPSTDWAAIAPVGAYVLNNSSRVYVAAGEALVAGQVVGMGFKLGPYACYKANAAVGAGVQQPAHGIVLNSPAAGQVAEVLWLRGVTTGIGGLVQGNLYYLAEVAGLITNAAPVGVGKIKQVVGHAFAATLLMVDISMTYITL